MLHIKILTISKSDIKNYSEILCTKTSERVKYSAIKPDTFKYLKVKYAYISK